MLWNDTLGSAAHCTACLVRVVFPHAHAMVTGLQALHRTQLTIPLWHPSRSRRFFTSLPLHPNGKPMPRKTLRSMNRSKTGANCKGTATRRQRRAYHKPLWVPHQIPQLTVLFSEKVARSEISGTYASGSRKASTLSLSRTTCQLLISGDESSTSAARPALNSAFLPPQLPAPLCRTSRTAPAMVQVRKQGDGKSPIR